MRTSACLDVLERTRERLPETPLIPMTYSSLLEAYGWERFAADATAAGATSLIVADLPAGDRPELRRVQLVAPTSTDERIRLAGEQTDGWLYLVTVAGTTGARAEVSPALAGLVERARRATDAPLYAGFGISTPERSRYATTSRRCGALWTLNGLSRPAQVALIRRGHDPGMSFTTTPSSRPIPIALSLPGDKVEKLAEAA
jgi:tryptophan synthase alpha subunit